MTYNSLDGCISYVVDTRVLTFQQDQCNIDPGMNKSMYIYIDIYDIYGYKS